MDRRTFTMSAGAMCALGAPLTATAAVGLEGSVTRRDTGRLRLDWSTQHPVAVFASTDPDSRPLFMRPMRSGVRGGGIELAVDVAPRPYFLIEARDGASVRIAERLLPLQGGRNFRDLGGYRSEDGRQVRWGRIYRSGVMSGLTAGDLGYLSSLGIQVVCDLRTAYERTNEKSPYLNSPSSEVSSFDYDLGPSLMHDAKTQSAAIDAFSATYIRMMDGLRVHYTDMFDHLVRKQTPLAVNCSAGKDRTGVASALILSVLGVPREAVIADYALSQTFVPVSFYRGMTRQSASSGTRSMSAQDASRYAQMPAEVVEILFGSNPAVMRGALARVDAEFGGPVALAKTRYGLTDEKIAHMRSIYLI